MLIYIVQDLVHNTSFYCIKEFKMGRYLGCNFVIWVWVLMVDGGLRDMELLFKMNWDWIIGFYCGISMFESLMKRQTQQVYYSSVELKTARSPNFISCSLDWLQITTIKMDRGQLTFMGSTVCVMLTLNFSIQLLTQHLMCWKKPKEQKAIIIIILMAPLYAIDSFVGLLDILGSEAFFTFLDSVKECYEALVRILLLLLNFFA